MFYVINKHRAGHFIYYPCLVTEDIIISEEEVWMKTGRLIWKECRSELYWPMFIVDSFEKEIIPCPIEMAQELYRPWHGWQFWFKFKGPCKVYERLYTNPDCWQVFYIMQFLLNYKTTSLSWGVWFNRYRIVVYMFTMVQYFLEKLFFQKCSKF